MVKTTLEQLYALGSFRVPVSMPNRAFAPPSASMWAKFDILPSDSYRTNLKQVEQSGVLQITLFTPINTNTNDIDAKAEEIVAHFGTEKQHAVNGKRVIISSSRKNPAMAEDGGKWYMQPISIYYQVY